MARSSCTENELMFASGKTLTSTDALASEEQRCSTKAAYEPDTTKASTDQFSTSCRTPQLTRCSTCTAEPRWLAATANRESAKTWSMSSVMCLMTTEPGGRLVGMDPTVPRDTVGSNRARRAQRWILARRRTSGATPSSRHESHVILFAAPHSAATAMKASSSFWRSVAETRCSAS